MRSQPIRSHPRGDGSPRTAHPRTRPPLQVSGARPCRPLRAGQTRCCSACGDRTELCPRVGRRLVAPHPSGSAAAEVAEGCREHLSAGIAHPRSDGIDWCRSNRRLVCSRRAVTSRARPQLVALGLSLALRTRRAIDTGVRATSATTSRSARPSAVSARPVVRILRNLCPGNTPAGKNGCAAQSPRRAPRSQHVRDTRSPYGCWKLPADHQHVQRPLPPPVDLYNLSRVPCTEQQRRRAPRRQDRAAVPAGLDRTGRRAIGSCLHTARPRSRPCIPRRSSRRGAGA
ncbi:DUF6083 domain-containing protein [Streptomyces sp. AC512_CC834]|uniref:DUF6083 domain-containing protein n=1 Tax=Streptomyces sp. AC512_CC834 TaxID=2823691 RepID=UPI0035AE8D75